MIMSLSVLKIKYKRKFDELINRTIELSNALRTALIVRPNFVTVLIM